MAATSETPTKRQKTSSSSADEYKLIYWPGLPGRGEPIRLLFEETLTPYVDTAQSPSQDDAVSAVTTLISPSHLGTGSNPPICAPPVLVHGDLTINQLPNILFYLGNRLELNGSGKMGEGRDENAAYYVNELALTALDGLSNEAHDTHHPVATGEYYDDQKVEAKRKSTDYIKNRIPKFLGYFERVLSGEASKGGEWLYGGSLTYADLVLFQCIDGVSHAFPNAISRLRKEDKFPKVFATYERVKARPNVKAYLASERRQPYGMGIWRHYPELDEE